MSYQITDEEKNRVLNSSPYVLPDSPTSRGMTAPQIKEYHYKAYLVLIEIINKYLASIESEEATIKAGKSRVNFCLSQSFMYYRLSDSVIEGDMFVVKSADSPYYKTLCVTSTSGTGAVDDTFSGNDLLNDSAVFSTGKTYGIANYSKYRFLCLGDGTTEELLIEHMSSERAHEDIRALITSLQEALATHNVSETAHEDVRALIEAVQSELLSHNDSEKSHSYIRELIELAKQKATSAYNLASGKSKVHPVVDINGMYTLLQEGLDSINEGDVIVVAEPLVPEFIVYEKGASESGSDDTSVSDELAKVEYKAGGIYYLSWLGVRVLALESGIDTSLLATKEELDKKQDKLTFEDRVTEGSQNPVTSDGISSELKNLSYAYDAIINGAKAESKQYTDERLNAHNESEEAHTDIRELIQKKEKLLLSRGSNRVHVKWSLGNMYLFLQEYRTNAGLLVDEYPVVTGDLIFVVENGLQVFMVYGVEPSATVIPDLDAFNECPWENDTVYYIEPLKVYLWAMGSKLDARAFNSGAEWRLIRQLKLEEEVPAIISKDGDGNAFALSEVMVIIECPAITEATQVWLKHNDKLAVFTNSVSTGTPAMKIEGKYNSGYGDWFYNTIACTAYRTQQLLYSYPLGHRYSGNLDKDLSSITLALSSDLQKPLPVGTKITVLGVDSK